MEELWWLWMKSLHPRYWFIAVNIKEALNNNKACYCPSKNWPLKCSFKKKGNICRFKPKGHLSFNPTNKGAHTLTIYYSNVIAKFSYWIQTVLLLVPFRYQFVFFLEVGKGKRKKKPKKSKRPWKPANQTNHWTGKRQIKKGFNITNNTTTKTIRI